MQIFQWCCNPVPLQWPQLHHCLSQNNFQLHTMVHGQLPPYHCGVNEGSGLQHINVRPESHFHRRQFKYVGLTLDRKLTFDHHITDIHKCSQQRLHVILSLSVLSISPPLVATLQEYNSTHSGVLFPQFVHHISPLSKITHPLPQLTAQLWIVILWLMVSNAAHQFCPADQYCYTPTPYLLHKHGPHLQLHQLHCDGCSWVWSLSTGRFLACNTRMFEGSLAHWNHHKCKSGENKDSKYFYITPRREN